MVSFSGKLLILGCGSVSKCVLSLLFQLMQIPPKNVTVISAQGFSPQLDEYKKMGVAFVQATVTRENYKSLLSSYLSAGDFLLDLSVEIDTCSLFEWCFENQVLFVNTATEVWAAARVPVYAEARQQTLYQRYLRLWKTVARLGLNGPTAILEHGANPGLVSHFVKKALLDLAEKTVLQETSPQRKGALQEAVRTRNFARLAMILGVRAIHIAERDTQQSAVPRQANEFVNTWSCEGFVEEAIAPAEIGWGTHEKKLPHGAGTHPVGPQHQIFLEKPGFKTLVKSWVPSGEIEGMVIRHGEAASLCSHLSVFDGLDLLYRPTVHYAYAAIPDAIASLHEVEACKWKMLDRQRILADEISSGADELGCLILGDGFQPFWIGSILDIEEARKLAPHQNATTLQVAVSVVASMCYAVEHPRLGFCLPDNIDHEYILSIATPYLGKFVTVPSDWSGVKENPTLQFTDFLAAAETAKP